MNLHIDDHSVSNGHGLSLRRERRGGERGVDEAPARQHSILPRMDLPPL
jgi:hypothetical protein